MEKLFKKLELEIPEYQQSLDPTKKDTGEWVEKLPKLLLPKKKKIEDTAQTPAKRQKTKKEGVEVDCGEVKQESEASGSGEDCDSDQIRTECELPKEVKKEEC